MNTDCDEQISVTQVWEVIYRGKWIILAVVLLFLITAFIYTSLTAKWYTAEVLLAPVEEKNGQSIVSQFGGLADLAGFGTADSRSIEAIAVLKSRDFAREFIEEKSLLPVFFKEDWNEEMKKWEISDPKKQPDVRDAVEFFHDKVLGVTEETDTGLVTLEIQWTDASDAAAWSDEVIDRLNNRLRQRALKEAQTNIDFLQEELDKSPVFAVQQAIVSLLETEMQKIMLARGNIEYAFRIIDGPVVPKYPSYPKPILNLLLAVIMGGMIGICWILLSSNLIKREKASDVV